MPETTTKLNRPITATLISALLAFLGVTALGGGIEMLMFPGGNQYIPSRWLESLPLVDTYTIPGLILGLGFGASSLVVSYGVLRKPRCLRLHGVERSTGHHWSWAATCVIGAAMMVWIVLEVIWIPDRSPIEAVYGALGFALVVMPWSPAVRRYLAAGSASRGDR